MKKPSLKETASRQFEEKERFIHDNSIPSKYNDGKESLPHGSKEVKLKKTSSYIPWSLWVKYKAYELSQAEQGRKASLNGLIMDLLEEFFKKQNI